MDTLKICGINKSNLVFDKFHQEVFLKAFAAKMLSENEKFKFSSHLNFRNFSFTFKSNPEYNKAEDHDAFVFVLTKDLLRSYKHSPSRNQALNAELLASIYNDDKLVIFLIDEVYTGGSNLHIELLFSGQFFEILKPHLKGTKTINDIYKQSVFIPVTLEREMNNPDPKTKKDLYTGNIHFGNSFDVKGIPFTPNRQLFQNAIHEIIRKTKAAKKFKTYAIPIEKCGREDIDLIYGATTANIIGLNNKEHIKDLCFIANDKDKSKELNKLLKTELAMFGFKLTSPTYNIEPNLSNPEEARKITNEIHDENQNIVIFQLTGLSIEGDIEYLKNCKDFLMQIYNMNKKVVLLRKSEEPSFEFERLYLELFVGSDTKVIKMGNVIDQTIFVHFGENEKSKCKNIISPILKIIQSVINKTPTQDIKQNKELVDNSSAQQNVFKLQVPNKIEEVSAKAVSVTDSKKALVNVPLTKYTPVPVHTIVNDLTIKPQSPEAAQPLNKGEVRYKAPLDDKSNIESTQVKSVSPVAKASKTYLLNKKSSPIKTRVVNNKPSDRSTTTHVTKDPQNEVSLIKDPKDGKTPINTQPETSVPQLINDNNIPQAKNNLSSRVNTQASGGNITSKKSSFNYNSAVKYGLLITVASLLTAAITTILTSSKLADADKPKNAILKFVIGDSKTKSEIFIRVMKCSIPIIIIGSVLGLLRKNTDQQINHHS